MKVILLRPLIARREDGCERATGDLLVPEGALLEFRDIAFVGGEAVERRRPVHVAIFHAERAVGVEDDGAFVGRGPRDEPAHGVVARAVAGGPEGGRVCGGEQREDELHGKRACAGDKGSAPNARCRPSRAANVNSTLGSALGVRRRPGLSRAANVNSTLGSCPRRPTTAGAARGATAATIFLSLGFLRAWTVSERT